MANTDTFGANRQLVLIAIFLPRSTMFWIIAPELKSLKYNNFFVTAGVNDFQEAVFVDLGKQLRHDRGFDIVRRRLTRGYETATPSHREMPLRVCRRKTFHGPTGKSTGFTA